jgi:hypothetical protein
MFDIGPRPSMKIVYRLLAGGVESFLGKGIKSLCDYARALWHRPQCDDPINMARHEYVCVIRRNSPAEVDHTS